MSNDEDKAKIALAGCLSAILTTLIQLPLFCMILVGLLIASDAPTWTWVLFWIYIPVGVILAVFRALVEGAARAS